jgi:hypothetical protein
VRYPSSHHFPDPFFSYAYATGHEFFPHLWPTVFVFDLCMDGQDVYQQSFIADALAIAGLARLGSGLASSMFEVAAGTHAQNFAA